MERIKLSDISFSSDSEDLFEDYWFTSPNASFDGSSVNSIPWAEDVVKQNQILWDSIERMFYGEEPLPENDAKLRNEIIEWTTHFPYLRIVGKSMPTQSCSMDNNAEDNDVLSTHLPFAHDHHKSARTIPLHRSEMNGILEEDFGRCLRITSGPLLVRRMQNRIPFITRTANVSEQPKPHQSFFKSAIDAVPNSNVEFNKHFGVKTKLYRSMDSEVIPHSAHSVKIPLLNGSGHASINGINIGNANKFNLVRVKTATLVPIHRPLRNSVTLPSINIEPKYLNHPTAT